MIKNKPLIRPVILCGGSGTRLWPESRSNYPKQFLPFSNDKNLFQLTLERFSNKELFSKPVIVTNKDYKFYIKNILNAQKIDASLILEPSSRGTTASIYIVTQLLSKNEILFIVPSDHLIQNQKYFEQKLLTILSDFHKDYLITFGIKPKYPSTAYGYLKVSAEINNFKHYLKVEKFLEKPKLDNAKKFLKKTNYLWNAGLFLGLNDTFYKSISTYSSEVKLYCDKVLKEKELNIENEIEFEIKSFNEIPNISIDYSVMEKSKKIICMPYNSAWNDVGSWDAFVDANKDIKRKKNVIELNSYNNSIRNNEKLIATIGIKNTIIVDTPDATLVVKKGMSEKVKDIVETLKAKKNDTIKTNIFEFRPWGKFENLQDSKDCKVKKLIINPFSRLSLQYHRYRSEHWTIVKGEARVFLNGNITILKEKKSIDIPKLSQHYISNETSEPLIIIEIQMGSYFGEDDIIRLDDPYQRN